MVRDNKSKISDVQMDNYLSMARIKNLKSRLPKEVTYVSMYKDYKGEHSIKAIINKESFYFSVPDDLIIREAQEGVLEDLIMQKVKSYVR